MTLAPSHRRPSNGNSLIAFLILFSFSFVSCGIFGPKGPKRGDSSVNQNTDETTDQNRPKVDTVSLVDITEKSIPPIKEVEETFEKSEMKSAYDVAMLFPFNAIRYQNISSIPDSKGKRFIQYYAGARIAIDDLMAEGKRINVHTFDTEESESKVNSLLNDQSLREADLIIGPYRTSNLETVANFARERQIPCASPWVPGFNLKEGNPYLIHMTPGLSAHAEAIFKHIETSFSDPDVYVVVRDRPNELNRLKIFQEAHQRIASEPGSLKELIINDNTSDLQNTDILSIMEEASQAIFIIPYYSRNEESFINSVLRKLHAERYGEDESVVVKDVVVFGMPQWLNFRELNYDYLESLKAHVSTISFSNPNHPNYSRFKTRFFDRYGIVPDPAAFQGYDLTFFFGTLLHEKGTGFLNDLENGLTDPMNLGLNIQPVYLTPQLDRSSTEKPLNFENRGIRILQFSELEFHLLGQ